MSPSVGACVWHQSFGGKGLEGTRNAFLHLWTKTKVCNFDGGKKHPMEFEVGMRMQHIQLVVIYT
jgi:hypothetical protein